MASANRPKRAFSITPRGWNRAKIATSMRKRWLTIHQLNGFLIQNGVTHAKRRKIAGESGSRMRLRSGSPALGPASVRMSSPSVTTALSSTHSSTLDFCHRSRRLAKRPNSLGRVSFWARYFSPVFTKPIERAR
jgi:hypothetical protein